MTFEEEVILTKRDIVYGIIILVIGFFLVLFLADYMINHYQPLGPPFD